MADEFHLQLSAAYLPGELNVLADMLSRSSQILKNEWSLGHRAFQWLVRLSPFGPPQVDLFANRFNHKLPRFFSALPGSQGDLGGRSLNAVAGQGSVRLSASYNSRSLSLESSAGKTQGVVVSGSSSHGRLVVSSSPKSCPVGAEVSAGDSFAPPAAPRLRASQCRTSLFGGMGHDLGKLESRGYSRAVLETLGQSRASLDKSGL